MEVLQEVLVALIVIVVAFYAWPIVKDAGRR